MPTGVETRRVFSLASNSWEFEVEPYEVNIFVGPKKGQTAAVSYDLTIIWSCSD